MIRFKIFLVLFFLVTSFCFTQNLVPNYSFETYSNLPSAGNQLNYSPPWNNVNGVYFPSYSTGSPDYYHLNGGGGVNLPSTTYAYLNPFTGSACAGFATWNAGYADYREYLSVGFTSPMIPGITYNVSITLTNGGNPQNMVRTNNIGIRFSNNPLSQNTFDPINVVPQLEITSIVDTTGWKTFSFQFTADSAYSYITIGNFRPDASTSNISYPGSYPYAYYYIDNVIVSAALVIASGPSQICSGDAATFTASGSSGYWWSTLSSPGSSIDNDSVLVVSPSSTTSYIVHSAAGNDTVTLNVLQTPVVNLGADLTQCGGSVSLNAGNPGMSYSWSTGSASQNISVSSTGTYIVQVSNGTCIDSDTINVTINANPNVILAPDVTQCGGTYTINGGTHTGNYLWSTGAVAQNITVSSTGTYWLEVNNNGCIDRDTINVTINPSPVVNLGNDTSFCSGNLTLNAANPGASYSWSDGSAGQTLNVSASGIYWVTVNAAGCPDTDTISVNIGPVPYVDLGNDSTICSGGIISLDAGNAGASFLWSDGSVGQTISISTTGTYWVTADINGCTDTDTVDLTFSTTPVVDLGNDTTFCSGTMTLNAGNPGSNYSWSTGASSSSITVSSGGTYWVTADLNNCMDTDSIVVNIGPVPSVNLGNDTSVCSGATITLDAGNPGASFLWSNGSNSQVVNFSSSGNYWVMVDLNGCTDTDTVDLSICPSFFSIPNVFTPNSDGMNDVFEITVFGYSNVSFEIFDRWGIKLFESDNISETWDGKSMQGDLVPDGVYYYLVRSKNLSGEINTATGFVHLIR